MSVDNRQAAQECIAQLTAMLRSSGDSGNTAIAAECEALGRAIAAFHMEGIRFRMYNVDRLLRAQTTPPQAATSLLERARKHLEAAGFHTRSHQAPI